MDSTIMTAFHGQQSVKDAFLATIRSNIDDGRLVHGLEGGSSTACTVGQYAFKLYESELGIPEVLARIEDRIFDGLRGEQALAWPVEFLEAIEPGSDLSQVADRFFLRLLIDPVHGAPSEVGDKVCDLLYRSISGTPPDQKEWLALRRAPKGLPAEDVAYAIAHRASYAVEHSAHHAIIKKMNGRFEWMRDVLIEDLRSAPVLKPAA